MEEAEASAPASAHAPVLVERFVKHLNVAYKAVRLYPGASEIPRENATVAASTLQVALEHQPAMRLAVTRDGLVYEGAVVFPDSRAFTAFAREFYARQLSEVRFHAGCTESELRAFLTLLAMEPEDLAAAGGFEAGLWERGVAGVTVAEISTRIIDHEDTVTEAPAGEAQETEPWPPSRERVDELVEGALAGRPRDQRLLVRFLSDPGSLKEYLKDAAQGRGMAPDEAVISGRLGVLARCLRDELPEEREELLRSLAEALLDLDPETRQKVLTSRLLVEARRDDMVAAVVRQMSLDEVMEAILHDVDETDEARTGLARAIRNLALINIAGAREAVLPAAAAAMAARGLSEGFVTDVVQAAAPRRLEMHDRIRTSEAQPVESVLRLIDLTPEHGGAHAYDPGTAAIRTEASRGLTDGDVLAALVAIATLEPRADQFSSVMALLDDSIGLLVDQQEFDVAADAAEALTCAEQDAALDAAHRRRMRTLLKVLAKPEAMRAITAAMRVYRHDSPEHAACRRLLAVLGAQSIGPLLEVLAAEPDMASRKSIVELVSAMASRYIEELGGRVTDPRWYFVRNVIAILASTKDPRVLPYLERTLRHPDGRVRRETVRAVAGIRDSVAEQMLAAALGDSDAGNVQLAARYLGAIGCRGAAPALEAVARGEGRGNRDNGPRIEAIEALVRLGEPSSVSVLEGVARQRGLLGGRTRQVRAAAAAALDAIRRDRHETGGAP